MPQRLAVVLGEFKEEKMGHPLQYYIDRGAFLDCRGPITISPTAMLGYCVTVLTGSHRADDLDVVYRPIVVHDNAWVASNALLYNCEIGKGAIVAAGTVVRSRNVPPDTMVEGNPARVIARRIDGEWKYRSETIKVKWLW